MYSDIMYMYSKSAKTKTIKKEVMYYERENIQVKGVHI